MIQLLIKIIEKSSENYLTIFLAASFLAFSWNYFFIKKRYWKASNFLLMGILCISYLGGVLDWLYGLGGDSFLESRNFNWKEAYFWIITFVNLFPSLLIASEKIFILLLIESLVLSVFIFWAITKHRVILSVLIIVLFGIGGGIGYHVYNGFQMGQIYISELEKSFDKNPTGFKSTTTNIDLFVYIGESTSSLNMSLYGYPLPTTPNLDLLKNKDGFLYFNNIRSTHTHTSPSLLRAFSVISTKDDGRQVKWGIGRILKSSGIDSNLHSVQPLNGSFASSSRFIFDGINYDLPSNDRYKGNNIKTRYKDHELLDIALGNIGVTFFHSYAGHGNYLDFIDLDKSKKIHSPHINFQGINGIMFSENTDVNLSSIVENYNQAITYIDQNVSYAIENIKKRNKPAVLIYFSDHGESVYTKRGHDSSKFIDEMSTVPMVIYFNEAYQRSYPKIYKQYLQASIDNRTKFLDQITPTILDILRIKVEEKIDIPTLASLEDHPRPYIIERETLSGGSRINFNYDLNNGFTKEKFYGGTPEPTYISILSSKFSGENTICYHRSNSYAKALRASRVANCIEFDLTIDGDDLNVYHPPTYATGFKIEHIFSIAETQKNSLWIDSKNINNPIACNKLATYLVKNYRRVGKIFVEFPSESDSENTELRSCAAKLKAIDVRTSYYVPTHYLAPCSEDPSKNISMCKLLDQHVQKALASGIFTDLSFDFIGYPAMLLIQGAKKLRWNTWAIKTQNFHTFPRKDFDFIIMDTSTDPNTY